MKAFATLLDRLTYTPSRNGKLALMRNYFRSTPDPDRGYALAALTDGLPFSFPVRRIVGDLAGSRFDAELFRMSRADVGDTAETLALIWPDHAQSDAALPLSAIVAAIAGAPRGAQASLLEGWLDQLDSTGRWALLKFLGGAPRVGVSARLAKQALADAFATPVDEIEEVWHGLAPPYGSLFGWLAGTGPRPDPGAVPVFKPLMLANPLEAAELEVLDPSAFAVEWKWDGIRIQVAGRGGQTRLFSRSGDDIGASFPELVDHLKCEAILDGELLVVRDGIVAPFSDLQQRLNRKTVTRTMLRQFPVHVRLYDALELDGEDLRALPFVARRQRLEAWHGQHAPRLTDLSEMLAVPDMAALRRLWEGTRGDSIEGLMLKRKESPYLAGRPKGHWYKWKRAALTADCVLLYAQKGAGKRSSFYSDYTFGAWAEVDGSRTLVPVGKAYSGFTDAELVEIDRFIRQNTINRFGPVRSVTPSLVFEVAFDGVQASARHKSGIAMRFPRIARIRWDKPAAEADSVETLRRLIA